MKTRKPTIASMLLLALSGTIASAAQPTSAPELRVVVPDTGLAAVGYPRVFVRLFEEGRPKIGAAASPVLQGWQTARRSWADLNLAELEQPQTWYTAMLDTGASVHLVTRATAQRFGIATMPGFFYVNEGGFSNLETALSYPYSLALAGSHGNLGEFPVDSFVPVQTHAQFGVDTRPRNPLQLVQMGGVNLIGMPAVRRHLFEIDPSALSPSAGRLKVPSSIEEVRAAHTNLVGPMVRIRPAGTMPTNGILRLPLRYIDLNNVRLTLAGGRSPELTESPVLMGARAQANDRWFVGNWMLDTGATTSFISRRQALSLGWTPQSPESLSATNLTIRDVAGTRQWRMAMRLETLEFRNPFNHVLEYRDVTVLIQDVKATQPDGSQFALDGLIGNNLLLPSLKDLRVDGSGEWVAAPFKRVFIDGYRAELGLEPHVWPGPSTESDSK
jgi:hypothetical protein